MARKRITNLTEPGSAGWNPRSQQRADYNRRTQQRLAEDANNQRVDRRQQIAEGLGIPEAMGNEFTRGIGDRVVDAETYLKSQAFKDQATVALGLGGLTLAGAGAASYLGARNQQQIDFQPTDPFSVVGRMVNNSATTGGLGIGAVGVDPLAQARNSLRDASTAVGSPRVMEALAMDQIDSMAVVDNGMKQLHPEVAARIDQKAQELMKIQYDTADGARDYNPEKAYTDAIKIVEAEIRAGY